jgi:hypothetical protein
MGVGRRCDVRSSLWSGVNLEDFNPHCYRSRTYVVPSIDESMNCVGIDVAMEFGPHYSACTTSFVSLCCVQLATHHLSILTFLVNAQTTIVRLLSQDSTPPHTT